MKSEAKDLGESEFVGIFWLKEKKMEGSQFKFDKLAIPVLSSLIIKK
jgi:hypothetical protein